MLEVDRQTFLSVVDVQLSGPLDLEQLRPYCVIRLGDQHYRTDIFPPGSLELECRQTNVDDRRGDYEA